MTKKKKIILITVILAVILAAGTFAAIYLYINRFDASEYVQAVLDTSYKNETDQYVEITGISNKEAEKIFEDNLDATMAGFESSQMPEEMLPKYRELFGELAGKVSYTIGESEKQKDGTYTVSVIVKPITLFTDTYETFQTRAQEYAQEVTDSVMNRCRVRSVRSIMMCLKNVWTPGCSTVVQEMQLCVSQRKAAGNLLSIRRI